MGGQWESETTVGVAAGAVHVHGRWRIEAAFHSGGGGRHPLKRQVLRERIEFSLSVGRIEREERRQMWILE